VPFPQQLLLLNNNLQTRKKYFFAIHMNGNQETCLSVPKFLLVNYLQKTQYVCPIPLLRCNVIAIFTVDFLSDLHHFGAHARQSGKFYRFLSCHLFYLLILIVIKLNKNDMFSHWGKVNFS
jgi:hypothetical protein